MRASTSGASLLLVSALLVSLALVGCTTAPPVGHTDAELQEYVDETMNGFGAVFPDGEVVMPEVEVERYVDVNDQTTIMDCFRDEGMVVTGDPQTGMSWSTANDAEQERYAIAQLTCLMRFPVYPPQQGFLTEEQHAYLYDYFQRVLIPCLELRGHKVPAAPTREQFGNRASADAIWNPYSFISFPPDLQEAQELLSMCPSSPFRPPVAD